MEKVIVVKAIPGILNVGDVLTSAGFGSDFLLETSEKTSHTTSERYVNLDYFTVMANIPTHFENVIDEYLDETYNLMVTRSNEEIFDRYNTFLRELQRSAPMSEQETVYSNLLWFIDWLTGNKELI